MVHQREQKFLQNICNELKDHLKLLKSMSVQEYILFQKWDEVNALYPVESEYSNLFDAEESTMKNEGIIRYLKSQVWNDTSIDDLDPILVLASDLNESFHWNHLRIMIHSQQNSGAIGRSLNYFVKDHISGKYLGLISVASDFLDISARDNAIGWTRDQRTNEQRIKHTAVCSSIVPVQPFGYNFCGGKLLSLLAISDKVQKDWKDQYGDILVGMTTTSLYGQSKGLSQYDGLRFWKRMGYSKGSTAIKPSIEMFDRLVEWSKENAPDLYKKYIIAQISVRDRKNRFLMAVYREMNIPSSLYTSNHDRGVYFARLYENTDAFLRNEISEGDLILKPGLQIQELISYWKRKYALPRSHKLKESKTISSEGLFYDDLSRLSWQEARLKYLSNVGR